MDEIPVGCIIVKDNKIIAKAHNTKQKSHKCIDHAEIKAIIKAEKELKDWRLDGCELYVTLEPCKMCREVIRQARISHIYYLLQSNFNNENGKNIEYIQLNEYSDNTSEYSKLLKQFFDSKR